LLRSDKEANLCSKQPSVATQLWWSKLSYLIWSYVYLPKSDLLAHTIRSDLMDARLIQVLCSLQVCLPVRFLILYHLNTSLILLFSSIYPWRMLSRRNRFLANRNASRYGYSASNSYNKLIFRWVAPGTTPLFLILAEIDDSPVS
jgi:hypothetical protein